MTDAIKEFIEEAREVSIAQAAERLRLAFKQQGSEHPQPCPVCGGKDRFAFNTTKNKWHCRGAETGGQDAIGMAAHVLALDLQDRAGFLEACAAVTGWEIPVEGERESEEDREARLARIEELKRKNAAEAEKRERAQVDFREKERRRARGIYEAAETLDREHEDHVSRYLQKRGCGRLQDRRWLRIATEQTYWHGQDERGGPLVLHAGPAMIAPFIDASGEIIGCHITWIDLDRPPKYRPALFALTPEGLRAGRPAWDGGRSALPPAADIDAGYYEALPTKKMRGTKKGGLIPLAGEPSARRWLGAEGIENTLAFARWEGFRADTFYFAAGDLGNMAGPADPKSRRKHPTLTKPDRNGRERPVMVPGPVPLFKGRDAAGAQRQRGSDAAGAQNGKFEPDAMVVPDHVDELVLLGDGDSEPVMTAAAMVRAKARHARLGRLIPIIMPHRGTDFAAMLAGHADAYRFEDGVNK